MTTATKRVFRDLDRLRELLSQVDRSIVYPHAGIAAAAEELFRVFAGVKGLTPQQRTDLATAIFQVLVEVEAVLEKVE